MNYLQQLLLSEYPLFVSRSGYVSAMISAFPQLASVVKTSAPGIQAPTSADVSDESYQHLSHEAFVKLCQILSQAGNDEYTRLTDDYASPELPSGSVAYHRIFGLITAQSLYRFSTKQFEKDLIEAERNPQIIAHLLHINSPGGEAWYLDRLSETLDSIEKPIVALYEQCASAAYHIGCHAARLYANTQFDYVGCIGTMISFWDFSDYYKQFGLKLVEAKADGSDLKNKMFADLIDGKPRQYVERVLNPLNEQFLTCVKTHRPALNKLPADHPVLRGETYFTAEASDLGLCDGSLTLLEALQKAIELGTSRQHVSQLKHTAYSML